ncbi:MAG TPA: glycine cleavage system aminomethyltransferase GcvT [Clostridiales bacterium]|nr:MAG: Aminomethyltransferase [Firmicutes bacterium ADurb.Bin262]HOU09630.1 glycine cleavage system aminomethyltransferase GcvT [Clostridiales bacterium]HQH64389.1 glycine cleavage system aminomethyltransferase GcvT [Clostridiales bacterium]HQK74008.1 glycine cleavage system aminomethyltransferase GcvT [Clostridiales bacterium]
MEKKTALYDAHLRAKGKMVPFAGYLLPVSYEAGIAAEHMAVRTAAGLFDVSHMGEVLLSGSDAFANLQNLLTNNFSGMADGQIRYSPMCNTEGGTVDDLLVYRKDKNLYEIVLNAANREKDIAWIQKQLKGHFALTDISESTSQIAIQGPRSAEILAALADSPLSVKHYTFTENIGVAGARCLVSRTGYTGEDGFELYMENQSAPLVWDTLTAAGRNAGLLPCGLGARDTLRLEAAMPLYGHELDEDITPLEAGLGRFVRMDKDAFIGKEALLSAGIPRRGRIGLEILDRGIARAGDKVILDGREIGYVTSGTMAPYLGKAIAMALIESGGAADGDELGVDCRGRMLRARVTALPFYKAAKK